MTNKFIQSLLVATVTTVIAASTAFAANHWSNETGEWKYLDKNNNVITDDWAQSGANWYYVDSTGSIVTDTLLDVDNNFYYLDANGVMASNQWVKIEDNWYYFGANGKAYKTDKNELTASALKDINGKKYAFDADGKMLYGWIDASAVEMIDEDDSEGWKNAMYFAGTKDDGAITIGWRQISVEDDDENKDYWFYFKANGKKNTSEKQTINGKTYRFNTEDGHMLSEWAPASASNATASNMIHINDDGSVTKKGWVWAIPDEDYLKEDYDDDEYSWWYTDNSGKIIKNTMKKINGKYYSFDEYGRMLYGLVSMDGDNYVMSDGDKDFIEYTGDQIKAGSFGKLYYFSIEDDGSRKSGTIKITLEDDTYDFYFKSNGEAEDGYVSKIKKYTKNGIILKASKDEGNYAGLNDDGSLSYGNNISVGQILVNTSGAVAKNKNNVNDGNDVYIFTDKDGIVVYVGDKLKSKKDGSIEVKGKTYEID